MLQTPQQLASNPKNSSWVFASAGSGKTKILTDRVLRLLLADVVPSKILCLTFTKAAAAEMENRINAALAQWILCSDEELYASLQALSGNFPSAEEIKKARTLLVKIIDEEAQIKVQTIHAFCQTLIKIFPFEAKVKPTFEVLEENQEKLLLKQAQQEMRKKAKTDKKLRDLIIKINSKLHDESLVDLVSELLNKKEKFLFLKEEFFGIDGVITKIFKEFSLAENDDEQKIFENFLEKLDKKNILTLAQILERSDLKSSKEMALKIRNFFDNPSLEKFPAYKLTFLTGEDQPRKIFGKPTEDVITAIEEQCHLISEFSNRLNSLKIAKDTALILHFTDQILQNYSQLKNRKALLDYDDLIIESNKLLADPQHRDWIKLKIDSNFDHILIDESQDTNHQQWNIIKSLSEDFFSGMSASNKDRSIFIVGDEKQSIFSFQGSDANISAEIFSYFEKKLGGALKKITLSQSFRSTKEILAAVDKVFANPERQNAISKVGEVEKHQVTRSGTGLVEIWPQIKNEKAEEAQENYEWQIDFNRKKEPKESEVLAEIIARKIKNWVENAREIAGCAKAINYGDIMILLRNRTNGFLEELVKYFHQNKIPFTSIARIKFSDHLLIQDLLAAARFALLPQDDLNLACLLKSPFFAISEERLLEICLKKNAEKNSIYEAITEENLKNQLDEIIQKSRQLNCFEFFYFLLHDKNHHRDFLAYFGVESAEILDKFLLAVFDFCKNSSPQLQKFLEFVEKIDPHILLSDSENNRVKITTVHSSKGLQAPIVIIPDCCYDLKKLSSSKEKIFWINDLPLWCSKKSNENSQIKIHRAQRFNEVKEEQLRLLYVAMTRAADELYIGGFGQSSDAESWYEIVKNSLPKNMVSKDSITIPFKEDQNTQRFEEKTAHQLNFVSPTLLQKENNAYERIVTKPSSSQITRAFIKGEIIHKILEIFGKNYREEKDWLRDLAQKIIDREKILTTTEKKEISDLTSNFLNSSHFSKIFSGEIKCEIEITANKIFGRIDLLIEKENEIIIIDYKSDEHLPTEIPQDYLEQLNNYKKLLTTLNPQKNIRCAILWIRFLKLQFISDNRL